MQIAGAFDLTYCGNVHAPRSLDVLLENLSRFSGPLRRRLDPEGSRGLAGVGLYFGSTLLEELTADPAARDALTARLEEEGLFALTANAFPYGDFHADRVKHEVYRPEWSDPRRRDYTLATAELLAALPHADRELSLSTLPARYGVLKGEERGATIQHLGEVARGLAAIEDSGGPVVRLAIEPEPGCAFERIDPLLAFLNDEVFVGNDAELRRRHLGVCLDVCHQAVEFEDLATCLRAIEDAGVALPKVQVSSALALQEPGRAPKAREDLARFDEPRYLHQVFARRRDGGLDFFEDLGDYLPVAEARDDAEMRCHFHVPVHRERYGQLGTTHGQLEELLRHLRLGRLRPHLEVETYTWDVLPQGEPSADTTAGPEARLLDNLEQELRWVMGQLERP